MATELWAWQAGGSDEDLLYAAAVGSDGSSILAGNTDGNWSTGISSDAAVFDVDGWAAVKLDSEGEILWTWQSEDFDTFVVDLAWNGIRGVAFREDRQSVALFGNYNGGQAVVLLDSDDGSLVWVWEDYAITDVEYIARKIAMAEDGSMVFAGETSDDWAAANAGITDFVAGKLDANGTLVWRWQGGGSDIDELGRGGGIGLGQDGSTVLCGDGWGNFSGSDPVGDFRFPDLAAVKLDADGNELWRWQNGSSRSDFCTGVIVDENDGSVVLAGSTDGDWSGQYGGSSDFIAVKLDAEGREVWRWQGGTEDEDYITGAAGMGTNDGSVVLCGYTDGNWFDSSRPTATLTGLSDDFAVVALASNGSELWRWQGGSAGSDQPQDISASEDGRLVLAGFTDGLWGGGNVSAGERDFVAVMLGRDGGSYLDGAGAGSGDGGDTSSEPEVSGDGYWASDVGGIPVSTLAGAFAAAVVFGVLLIGLGRAWARRESAKRRDANGEVQATRSSGHLGSAGKPSTNGNGGGFDFDSEEGDGGDDPGYGRRPRQQRQQKQQQKQKQQQQRAALDPSTEGAFGNPVFDHRNGRAPAAGAPAVAAGRGGPSDGGAGGSGSGSGSDSGSSWKDRGLATFIPVSAEDDAYSWSRKEAQPAAGRTDDRQGSSLGFGVRQAVLEAAQELAARSQMPGVSEVAGLVVILVNLVADTRGNAAASDQTIKRCRSIVTMLNRAAEVLGTNERGDDDAADAGEEAGRVLVEDVHDAIADLVELIRTYQSKNKLSQVLMSTLFKRRQEEAEAVIERAISRLQLGMHIQVGRKLDEVGRDVKEGLRLESARALEGAKETSSVAESLAEARRQRRQRKLDQIEIPSDHVAVSDELLGKGGFGAVYIADFNGRNAAVKVLQMDDHELGMGAEGDSSQRQQLRQRKAFLQELNAMIRLRSPHTVNVFGAITSHKDRLILVMELMSGGDLRAFLKRNADRSLRKDRARRIIGDVCAGMAFLHGKATVHGDLKSANVLLDGAGRAKIGDFGTSRWAKHSNSTGLATYTSSAAQGMEMSLAWAAPEVLETKGISFASDAYSFGIVSWEVLTRKVPWADVPRARDVFLRVVMRGERPEIPANAPRDIAGVIRACWADAPGERPAMSAVMEGMRSHGWED